MEYLENWLTKLVGGDTATVLVLHVGIVLVAVVIFNFALHRALVRFEKETRRTASFWDDALVSAALRPVALLAWVVGLAFAGEIVEVKTEIAFLKAIPTIRTIGVIACLAWFSTRFIRNAQEAIIRRKLARGESIDRTTMDAVGQLLRIAVVIVAALVGLQSLGFSISGVLAFGGIGGIAVGFAAKDLLANFFGSLMIYLDRPFAVGDWVRSPEKQIEGTVEEIGWRLTRIRTFDKRPLYVPNSVFASITVENPSRMSNRRINETIGVRYDDIDAVKGIVEDIRAMLRAHPEIDTDQTLIVNLLQFNEFSLDILVYTFTRTTVWVKFHEVKQDVLLKIADIIARHGAEIAYPTRISYSSPLPSARPVEKTGGDIRNM
ncbi:MAG: mechanosensitive ion channel family protein [Zoogloeaceae bacterium]|jgi:MscS family membrane protein|nr:mechanosensitive ion channel family protein [Zoogloeaceae bacterium]